MTFEVVCLTIFSNSLFFIFFLYQMLVEFRVKNFRSFKEEQVLSLVATKDNSLENNKISTSRKDIPSLLRCAVIYGANASGKSNLLKAMACMRSIFGVVTSPEPQRSNILDAFKPFLLDLKSHDSPITFEITFILNDVRYQYSFSWAKERIVSEYLLAYKTARPQKWFERRFNEETNEDEYTFSSFLNGDKQSWKKQTRNDALFLWIGTQYNSQQLIPIFNWIFQKFNIALSDSLVDIRTHFTHMSYFQYTLKRCKEDQVFRRKILNFMISCDTGITDICINPNDQLFFVHGMHSFPVSEESAGTVQLFSFAGIIQEVLDKGHIFIIDELDCHLHPLLVRKLVKRFHDPEENRNNAQMIFVTHDVSLLKADLFRRDQIWFVEKDPQTQESTLYPLSDFKHKDDDMRYIDNNYLLGCYGAIPCLRD
ncbi:MAG: ATP-binding protein [Acetobacter sp.]|nr:ATP-binding protein [Acetobacter sp.]